MKRTGRILSLKGVVYTPSAARGNEAYHSVFSDGREGYGWKVVSFEYTAGLNGTNARTPPNMQLWTLSKEESVQVQFTAGPHRFNDNRMIAYNEGVSLYSSGVACTKGACLLDPNHIVARDLGIYLPIADTDEAASYLIILEEYTISDKEEVISLIKAEGQKVGRTA